MSNQLAPITDYGVDASAVEGLTPEEAFVLGYEFARFKTQLDESGGHLGCIMPESHVERARVFAERCGFEMTSEYASPVEGFCNVAYRKLQEQPQ